MATTFLWHDYETFGLSPALDRPAQFAAIRTDEALDIVGEPICLYCKPPKDTMPDPQSIFVTGILPQHCEQVGMVEADFARAIHKEMSRAETISVGYNSMRFDDEVTRNIFWRNFFDPYSREYENRCSRFDLFPLVVATWALRPQGINWPKAQDADRPSFRLEHLSAANGLVHKHAHDALSDVEATIGIARLIREKQPKLWDYALKNRSKAAVSRMINSGKPLLWVSPIHGHERGYMRLVCVLGAQPGRANHVLMWDLSVDPSEVLSMTASEVRERLFVRKGELPEGVDPLPIFSCKINQAPFLVDHLGVLSQERAQQFCIDREKVLRHAAILAPHVQKLIGTWQEALIARDEEQSHEEPDVDASIYHGGFIGSSDKNVMQYVQRQTPEGLTELVSENRLRFDDKRLNEMLFRYRARNWPESLTEEEAARWHQWREDRLTQGMAGARSLEAFAEAIEELAQMHDNEQEAERVENICGALYDWAEVMSESLEY